jgi:hypothetical protein
MRRERYHITDKEMYDMGVPRFASGLQGDKPNSKPKDQLVFNRERACCFTHHTWDLHWERIRQALAQREQEKKMKEENKVKSQRQKQEANDKKQKQEELRKNLRKLAKSSRRDSTMDDDAKCFICGIWFYDMAKHVEEANWKQCSKCSNWGCCFHVKELVQHEKSHVSDDVGDKHRVKRARCAKSS